GKLRLLGLANPVVANGNHYPVKRSGIGGQRSCIADHLPGAVPLTLRPGVIEEHHLGPTGKLGGIGHHLPMATGAKHCKPHQFRLPVNFGMVASPSALIPSRTRTFLTVRKRILISSQSDRLSTYQTSSRNFSSHDSALRPLI